MQFIETVKKHIILGVLIFIAGIFAVVVSVILGYIGFAIIALIGLLASSSVMFFLLPYILSQKLGDNK